MVLRATIPLAILILVDARPYNQRPNWPLSRSTPAYPGIHGQYPVLEPNIPIQMPDMHVEPYPRSALPLANPTPPYRRPIPKPVIQYPPYPRPRALQRRVLTHVPYAWSGRDNGLGRNNHGYDREYNRPHGIDRHMYDRQNWNLMTYGQVGFRSIGSRGNLLQPSGYSGQVDRYNSYGNNLNGNNAYGNFAYGNYRWQGPYGNLYMSPRYLPPLGPSGFQRYNQGQYMRSGPGIPGPRFHGSRSYSTHRRGLIGESGPGIPGPRFHGSRSYSTDWREMIGGSFGLVNDYDRGWNMRIGRGSQRRTRKMHRGFSRRGRRRGHYGYYDSDDDSDDDDD